MLPYTDLELHISRERQFYYNLNDNNCIIRDKQCSKSFGQNTATHL